MKKIIGVYSLLLMLITQVATAEPKSYCWMQDVDDGWTITDLTIPGTHDSGTYDFNNSPWAACLWAVCQEYDIYGQLFLEHTALGYWGPW